MVIPARTDAHICLSRHPMRTIFLPRGPLIRVLRHAGINGVPHEVGPGSRIGKPMFVPHPAHIRSGIRKEHGARLQLPHQTMHAWPVVIGQFVHHTLLVGTPVPAAASIGSVKPDLKEFSIVGEEFSELIPHVGDVFWLAVVGMIAVPRRIVNPHFQPIFPTGIHKFPDQISFPISPRAVFDRMLRVGRGPKHKAIVVLGRDDQSLHPRLLGHSRPLSRIQCGRSKLAGLLIPKTPLPIREGIHVEMYKAVVLQLLPGQLTGFRNGINRGRRSGLCKGKHRKKK